MAARLAIARAQNQLSSEAGVNLHTKNFTIINQVGACGLDCALECNKFADAHPHDSHYDQQSFVGLAWRPAHEDICCEIYSTGRAKCVCTRNPQIPIQKPPKPLQFIPIHSNFVSRLPYQKHQKHQKNTKNSLPGSKRERDLQRSWSRMLPELLRFSANKNLMDSMPEELRFTHYPKRPGFSNQTQSNQSNQSNQSSQSNQSQASPFPINTLQYHTGNDDDMFADDDLSMLGL